MTSSGTRRWLLGLAVPSVLLGSLAALTGSVPRERRPKLPLVKQGLTVPLDDATAAMERLWQVRLSRYLYGELWRDDQAYNAGQMLQVPMHAAFSLGSKELIEQFARQFERFMDNDDGVVPADFPLNKLSYLYLASRFVALCFRTGRQSLVAPGLVDRVNTQVDRLWLREPAWMWGGTRFRGIAERVRWKLAAGPTHPSYYRAIIDQDLFPMVIAADLWQAHRVAGVGLERDAAVIDAIDLATLVFARRVVPTGDGGWLMQPGVWTDHPDMAFAGADSWSPGMPPHPVPGIAEDSSHSARYPLWLTSLQEAHPPLSKQRTFYSGLRSGLAIQLLNHVLVPPDRGFGSYRMTNYMDGGNGLYRAGNRKLGHGKGYGPYELSATFLLGWWSFLDHELVCEAYREQAYLFPLPDNVLRVYIGPGAESLSTITLSDPGGFQNGLRMLLVMLAASRCGLPGPENP